jgi:hypothetical protein
MAGEGVRSIARKVWIDAFPRLALTREEPLLRTFVRFRTLGQIFGRTNSGVPIKKIGVSVRRIPEVWQPIWR